METKTVEMQTIILLLLALLLFIIFLLFSFFGLAVKVTSLITTVESIIIYETSPIEEKPPVVSDGVISEYQSEIGSRSDINKFIDDVVSRYNNIDRNLVKSVIYHESRGNPRARNGNCVGLMQVSTYWHADRAEKLGVKDFFDPYGNILLGVDYLSELLYRYKDPALALMLYNMKHDVAFRLYLEGKISEYAKSVLKKAEEYAKEE